MEESMRIIVASVTRTHDTIGDGVARVLVTGSCSISKVVRCASKYDINVTVVDI